MGENCPASGNGNGSAGAGTQAAGFAPGGIRTMRDLANLNLRVGLGVLSGHVGYREATTATGSFREGRRDVIEGQKIGYEKVVFDCGADGDERDELLREEQELTARLEAIRERRGR